VPIVLRNLLFVLIFYPGSLLYVLAALAGAQVNPALLRKATHGWAAFHRACARVLLGVTTVVEGDIPEGPVIFALKHETMYETIEVLMLFKRPIVPAKAELADMPLWGKVATSYGVIRVEREAGTAALKRLLADARAGVAQGRPIAIFPEGTRVARGEAPPVRSGVIALYKQLGLPMVPVAVDTARRLTRSGLVHTPGTVRFRFADPIPPGLPREEAERLLHSGINALQ